MFVKQSITTITAVNVGWKLRAILSDGISTKYHGLRTVGIAFKSIPMRDKIGLIVKGSFFKRSILLMDRVG